jgi:retinol dehydrogenase 12
MARRCSAVPPWTGETRTREQCEISEFPVSHGEDLANPGYPGGPPRNFDSHLDFADLQSARNYRPFAVYATSKLCNILFTRELARKLSGQGVTANCFSSGFVATRFGDESGGLRAIGVRVAKLFAISPERGTETLVYLTASPDAASASGEFFYRCRPGTLTAEAQDDAIAQKLWLESERIAGAAAS